MYHIWLSWSAELNCKIQALQDYVYFNTFFILKIKLLLHAGLDGKEHFGDKRFWYCTSYSTQSTRYRHPLQKPELQQSMHFSSLQGLEINKVIIKEGDFISPLKLHWQAGQNSNCKPYGFVLGSYLPVMEGKQKLF